MAERTAHRLPGSNDMLLRCVVDQLPKWFTRELDAQLGKSDQPGRTLTGGIVRRLHDGDYFVEVRFRESRQSDEAADAFKLRLLLGPLFALPVLDLAQFKAGDVHAIRKYAPLIGKEQPLPATVERIGRRLRITGAVAQTVLREKDAGGQRA